MKIKVLGAMTLAAVMMVVASGCAGTGQGCDDGALIQQTLDKWIEACKAKDIEGMMAGVSENFSHDGYEYQAENKAAMKAFMEESIAQGNHDGVEITYVPESIEIEGDTATIYPIEWDASPGSVTIKLTMKKEGGAWLMVDAGVEGLY